jgi:hypothetical protein
MRAASSIILIIRAASSALSSVDHESCTLREIIIIFLLDLSLDELTSVKTALYGCFKNILIGYTGDSIDKCRVELFGAANELPGGDLILPVEIVDVLKKEIPNADTKVIKLNHKVTQIDWSAKPVIVKCADEKKEFNADFVISTLPAGVIRRFHKNIFIPDLPEETVQAYEQIRPGAVGKYFVEWNQSWRQAGRNDHPIMFAWSQSDLEEMELPGQWIKGVFEASAEDPFGTLMIIWIVGDCAKAADSLDDHQVKLQD